MCLVTVLVLAWVAYALYELRRHRVAGSVAFFHPFCSAGGGGEYVLWHAVAAVQQRWPLRPVYVYTGDTLPADSILDKVARDFAIRLPRPPVFVRLRLRRAMATQYPRLTLLLQSLGGALLGLEALWKLTPEVFIDTTGAAFAMAVFRWLGGARTACYVHYPTVSDDMLRNVSQRLSADSADSSVVNNSPDIAASALRTRAKLAYYRAFAVAYGVAGRSASVVMANSSWTRGHIASLWAPGLPRVVYPPCACAAEGEGLGDAELAAAKAESLERPKRVVLSIGQFRPEKRHLMQVKAMHALLLAHPEHWGKVVLVLVGGVRDAEDARRKEEVVAYASSVGLIAGGAVEVPEDTDAARKAELLRRAAIGLHTMRDEHFGICVVEYMANGAVPVAHRSAGPLQDIVVPAADPSAEAAPAGAVGFLAESVQEYAEAMHRLLVDEQLRAAMAALGRKRAQQFSVEAFKQAFVDNMDPLLH
eukprot:m51a1_g6004 hypothetical protein (476) ;mRNA; f:32358-33970